MEFKIYEVNQGNLSFRIEEDIPELGAFLYIYENDKCIKDYLQNDVETCMSMVLEDYGIPVNEWKLVGTTTSDAVMY